MTALPVAAHDKQHTEAYDSARLTYVRELGTAKSHPNTLGNGYQIYFAYPQRYRRVCARNFKIWPRPKKYLERF